MPEWVVAVDRQTANGLGEFLARSISGEWHELGTTRTVWYTLELHEDGSNEQMKTLARTIARFVVEVQEGQWLEEILRRRYRCFTEEEGRHIVRDAANTLHAEGVHDQDRMVSTTSRIEEFLADGHNTVVVEGIKNFLLARVRLEFEEAIDRSVDNFLMEKEHHEFVRLLQHFVDTSECRMGKIHVFQDQYPFYFEDDDHHRVGEDILEDLLSGLSLEDGPHDDLLVSALITLAPREVVMHQGPLDPEAKKTIEAVFEGRIRLCADCPRCQPRQLTDNRKTF